MDQNRERLIQAIFKDMTLASREIFNRKNVSPFVHNVPPAQGVVLHIVANHGGLSIKEIAEIMRVSRSAVTQFVDSLAKSGLLMRAPDPDDRRTVRISLTDEGKSKLEEFQKLHLENLGKILGPLSDQELTTFHALLQKVINNQI